MGEKDTSPYFSAIAEKYGECEKRIKIEKKEVEKRTIKKEKKEEG